MSKEDKKEKQAAADRRWRTGQINSKERKAMEALGLDTANYGWSKPDNPASSKSGDYDDMRRDFLAAAGNNYDMRRSMEAMAMSGKGKAEKLAEKGFRSTGDVMNATNMMRKAHGRNNNGGDFSSASDYAGVTYNAVQRDRKLLNKDVDDRISTATDELRDEMKTEEETNTGFKDPDKSTESDALRSARERSANFEAGMGSYGNDDEQDSASVSPATTDGKAQSMLDTFKTKLKEERNFKQDF